jgi:carbon starvation protein
MQRIIFNDRIDAALIALFLGVVVSILAFGIRTCRAALKVDHPTVSEIPPAMVPAE